jgi:hypothetical protein
MSEYAIEVTPTTLDVRLNELGLAPSVSFECFHHLDETYNLSPIKITGLFMPQALSIYPFGSTLALLDGSRNASFEQGFEVEEYEHERRPLTSVAFKIQDAMVCNK